MEEQGAAVHFDGTGQQTTKVIDVPEKVRLKNHVTRAAPQQVIFDSAGSKKKRKQNSVAPVLRGL